MQIQNRLFVLLLAVGVTCACGSPSKASRVTIEKGKVARINGCHVSMDLVRYYKDDSPMGDFRFVCNVQESALNTKDWWGDQSPPLMFSMLAGDCIRLEKLWYCVEGFESQKFVRLVPTYEQADRDITHINRIR